MVFICITLRVEHANKTYLPKIIECQHVHQAFTTSHGTLFSNPIIFIYIHESDPISCKICTHNIETFYEMAINEEQRMAESIIAIILITRPAIYLV